MSAAEAATYRATRQLAERSWPRWVVLYGWGSRRAWAFAAFLPDACILDDPDPIELGARMRAVEMSGRAAPS